MGADNPPPTDEKNINDVYHDRNLLAVAFARAIAITWGPDTAGWYWHDGWPVVWVDTPAGQKSWHVTPNLEDDKQLPIYLLACRDLYDESVTKAGYAYVGDIGPKVETRSFSESELAAVEEDVTAAMNRIAEFSFTEYSTGDHCQWCQHQHLPCAPSSISQE